MLLWDAFEKIQRTGAALEVALGNTKTLPRESQFISNGYSFLLWVGANSIGMLFLDDRLFIENAPFIAQ